MKPSRQQELALSLVLTLGAAACGGRPETPSPPPPGILRVINRTTSPAAVWVARESAHWRLGAVEAAGTADLPVPPSFLAQRDSVRFLAFRDDTACVQDARFATRGRRHFIMVLQRELANPDKRKPRPCRWD